MVKENYDWGTAMILGLFNDVRKLSGEVIDAEFINETLPQLREMLIILEQLDALKMLEVADGN